MFSIQHGETVEHVRWVRDDRNAHGALTPIFGPPVEVENVGVDVPSPTEPLNGINERQIVDLVIFLPIGSTVDHRDKFIVRGQEYQVVGDAPPIMNFLTGTPFLTETKLKRVTG